MANSTEETGSDRYSSLEEQTKRFRQLSNQLSKFDARDRKIVIAIDSISESLKSPLVFAFNSDNRETILCSGVEDVNPAELVAFAEKLLAKRKDGLAFTLTLNQPTEFGSYTTQSLAAAPVGRSGSWLCALGSASKQPLGPDELGLLALASTMLTKQLQHDAQTNSVKSSLMEMVRYLVTMIDAKDPTTAGHSDRVGQIASKIGLSMGLPAAEVNTLRLAGLMHDIGKIGIRDEILTRPGKLTSAELEHIQLHPVLGDEIISKISYFAKLRPGVRSHHERMDGKGYPDALCGEQIPLIARIIAVADSVDAMMSPRCYRREMSPPKIDQILLQFAGSQWDKLVVEAFMRCRDEIYPPIYRKPVGDTAMHAINDLVGEMINDSSIHYKLIG